MKNNIKNSCGKRGCEITLLPSDSRVRTILSGVHETKHDIQKVLSLAITSLDKELEKEGQVEKMAA
jgi:hypothetical protein